MTELSKRPKNRSVGFGQTERPGRANIYINDDLWTQEEKIYGIENAELVQPFNFEELDRALKEMKNNTRPSRDGISVCKEN